jgi:hypothetical protein
MLFITLIHIPLERVVAVAMPNCQAITYNTHDWQSYLAVDSRHATKSTLVKVTIGNAAIKAPSLPLHLENSKMCTMTAAVSGNL